jgi:hypothetical protein
MSTSVAVAKLLLLTAPVACMQAPSEGPSTSRRELLLGVSAAAASTWLRPSPAAAAEEEGFTSVIGDDEPSSTAVQEAAPQAAPQQQQPSAGLGVSTLVSAQRSQGHACSRQGRCLQRTRQHCVVFVDERWQPHTSFAVLHSCVQCLTKQC